MSDPRRLIDDASAFETELLRAGRSDALSEQGASKIAAALGVAPPAAAATTLGIGAKVATYKAALVIAGVGAAGALSIWATVSVLSSPAPMAAPPQRLEAREHVSSVAVRHVEPTAPAEAAETTEPAEAAERAPAKVTARDRSQASTDVDSLPLELDAIDRARTALARGDAPLALSLLDEYAARFPKPRLGAESTVLRIEALVTRGQNHSAVSLGKAFLARQPNGPYARRVRSLLERAGAPATR